MKYFRFNTTLIIGILMALIIVLGLYLRIAIPFRDVIDGQSVNFLGPDSYYHMRLVDSLFRHFPGGISFDPFTAFPTGNEVSWPPFFDWLISGIAWTVTLGSADQHIIDLTGAMLPPILGVITVIPVFFIGKFLFNRWAGLLAAALLAVTPGEFLGRTLLGYTDHHCAEVLLISLAMLFLVMALRSVHNSAADSELVAGTSGFLSRYAGPAVNRRLIGFALLAGVFLGFYLLTWEGGLLFVGLLVAYFVIQSVIDTWRGRSPGYLGLIAVIMFAASLALVLGLMPRVNLSPLVLTALAASILIPLGIMVIHALLEKRKWARFYYPAGLVSLGAVGLVVFNIVSPGLFGSIMAEQARIFNPQGAASTIVEMQPLFFRFGAFTLDPVWRNFSTTFFLGIGGLGVLVYSVIRRDSPGRVLFMLWSLVVLIATIAQVRFTYYLAVNVALLTAFLSFEVPGIFRRRKAAREEAMAARKNSRKKPVPGLSPEAAGRDRTAAALRSKKKGKEGPIPAGAGFRWRSGGVLAIAVLPVILAGTFLPDMLVSIDTARWAPNITMPAYWQESLSWLKNNTPEPFADPDYYYGEYPASGTDYRYPDSAYGVLAWWDYGHWITRVAHRIPVANPFQQGASAAARFFTSGDEAAAAELADQLGVKYVVANYEMTRSHFHSLAAFAGRPMEDFQEVYYTVIDGRYQPVILYYPEYYRSLAVRLFEFDGKAVEAVSPSVAIYKERVDLKGQHYKEIESLRYFSSLSQAEAFIAEQKSGLCRIAGSDPAVSPVSLEALEDFEPVYQSRTVPDLTGENSLPAVKIFEYRAGS